MEQTWGDVKATLRAVRTAPVTALQLYTGNQ